MTDAGMTTHDAPTPEKFDLRSLDLAAEKRAELLRLFPECATDGGKVDFERLKAALGEQIDAGKERYGLTWPGKAACFQTIQRPSLATLRPKAGESVDFDTTQNVIIEGDNLEVLKLLQKSYLGKVKMIYIDPPYNTGNDFIYPDNYTESLQTYLEYTGQVDAEGRKFSTNTEADGRFHSKWLNMMYPRLYLARNLLREDGVIFISIDDSEAPALRALCDLVFGEDNFVAQLVWEKSKKGDAKLIAVNHEYVVAYCRDRRATIDAGQWRKRKPGVDEVLSKYQQLRSQFGADHANIESAMRSWYGSLSDADPRRAHKHYRWSDDRGLYFADNFAGPDDGRASRPRHDIFHPVTGRPCKKPSTGWRWDEDRTKAAMAAQPPLIHFGPDESTIPCRKSYLHLIDSEPFQSVFYKDGRAATLELEKLLAGGLLEFPKDKEVLREFLELTTSTDSVVMDFFAGSGTTAQAVLEANAADQGRRRFVLVQLPEPTKSKKDDGTWIESAAWKAGYPTIADITKERVRRVIKNLNDADKGQLRAPNDPKPDRGFRVFQLAPSNFKPWDGDGSKDATALQQQLFAHVEHVLPDRSEQDLLYEILLKDGFELTTPVETFEVRGFRVHSVAGGELLLCLQDKLTHELIQDLAERRPSRVVFLDRGFRGNDQLKANAAKLFASKAGDNFKKFKTV